MKNHLLIGTITSAILLAGLPLFAIASHRQITSQDYVFQVAAQVTPRTDTENVDIWSEINALDLKELSGPNNFSRGDVIYVNLAKGPKNIAYPFAVTKQRPTSGLESTFSLRGKVTDRQGDMLVIRYNFETFLPPRALTPVLRDHKPHKTAVRLAVSKHGVGRLIAVEVDEKLYPYRVMEKPVLDGFIQSGARTAPIK